MATKAGRRPIGKRPMTGAERSRRFRQKHAAPTPEIVALRAELQVELTRRVAAERRILAAVDLLIKLAPAG